MNRRRFLGVLLGACAAPRVVADALAREKLPPPVPEFEPARGDFVRVVVPMAFYSHCRHIKLTWSRDELLRPYSSADAEACARLALDIQVERAKP